MTVEFISAINVREGDELNPQRGGGRWIPRTCSRYARTLEDAGLRLHAGAVRQRVGRLVRRRDRRRRGDRAHQADRRGAPEHGVPDGRGAAARDARPALGRPRGRAHHLGRQRRRAGAAGRLPRPRTSATTARRSGSGSSAGRGPRRRRSATRAATTGSTTSAPASVRTRRSRSRSADRRMPPTASAARSATSSGCGASRSPTRATRSTVSTESAARRRSRRHPAHLGDVPPDRRRDRRARVGEGAPPHREGRRDLRERRTGALPQGKGAPQNVGSQRLLDAAARGEVHDRALWTKPAEVTNARGASTALVGSYETVAAAILDYVDLGADLISIRGYDNLNDAIDYGRYVLPLVRQELAHREATGIRGEIVAQPPDRRGRPRVSTAEAVGIRWSASDAETLAGGDGDARRARADARSRRLVPVARHHGGARSGTAHGLRRRALRRARRCRRARPSTSSSPSARAIRRSRSSPR